MDSMKQKQCKADMIEFIDWNEEEEAIDVNAGNKVFPL